MAFANDQVSKCLWPKNFRRTARHNRDIVVVEVVVVDVDAAASGKAANNHRWTCTEAHLMHQGKKQHCICPHPLNFI